MASSFWLAALSVVGLALTAIGARSGLTARSSRLSQTLQHSPQIASSSVTFRACIEPTRRRWPSPSSRASTGAMAEGPRMNNEPEFLAAKLRRVQDPHLRPLNGLVERWRQGGRQVPYADPDSGGIRSRILFLNESPGRRQHRQ